MDEIQKVLVEAGRKDLAQKYYKKIARPTAWEMLADILFNSWEYMDEKEMLKEVLKFHKGDKTKLKKTYRQMV